MESESRFDGYKDVYMPVLPDFVKKPSSLQMDYCGNAVCGQCGRDRPDFP